MHATNVKGKIMEPKISKATRTTAQELARQKADAEREREARLAAKRRVVAQQPAAKQPQDEIERLTNQAVAPAKATSVAVPDTRDPRDQYLDRVAPATIVGRPMKFDTNEGRYVARDNDEEIDKDVSLIAHCDQTVIGWRRFHGKGEQPSYIVGMWYDGYVPPERDDLPDRHESTWEISELTGRPDDPWKEINWVVLQRIDTGEFFTFEASARTHISGVGALLRHYRRSEKRYPGQYPVVRLGLSGWDKGPPVGWVHKPQFIVVGHTAKDDATVPATLQEDLNDEIPDFPKNK